MTGLKLLTLQSGVRIVSSIRASFEVILFVLGFNDSCKVFIEDVLVVGLRPL